MSLKRSGIMLTLVLFAMLGLSLTLQTAHADSIKDKIVSSQGKDNVSGLEKQVDDSTQKVISSARKIFVTLTVVFGIWLGICYFRAGFSPDSLRETKGRIMFFVVFLILSFWTESILGMIFNFLGIDLGKL